MRPSESVLDHQELGGGLPPKGWQGAIAQFFQFDAYQTTLRTEVLAGITTFMTMGYILVVNPIVLSNAIFLQQPGDLFSQLAVATGIAAAVGTLCMAFFANYPFGLAPGMGTNAFFAFSVDSVLAFCLRCRTPILSPAQPSKRFAAHFSILMETRFMNLRQKASGICPMGYW